MTDQELLDHLLEGDYKIELTNECWVYVNGEWKPFNFKPFADVFDAIAKEIEGEKDGSQS